MRRSACGAIAISLCMSIAAARAGLVFNFTPLSSPPQNVIDGFAAAGARWSSRFSDDVTVNVEIGFPSLGGSTLGQTTSDNTILSYSSIRTALIADQLSTDDADAAANLQSDSALSLMINYTSDNPNGAGNATPYIDNDGGANNTNVRIHRANAKAIGLISGTNTARDAKIEFNSNFTWDFDPSDGVTGGQYDFVGVATHEIGHALGFASGVDTLDPNSPPQAGPFAENSFRIKVMDLYRFSTQSIADGGVGTIDFSADNRTKFFSLDGGTTPLANFATGVQHGDGRQASHWKDNQGIGIMDPTFTSGELASISLSDVRMMDVLGWDRILVDGDVDGDGDVDFDDYLLLQNNFGTTSGATRENGDLDGDGDVDFDDFLILQRNFGAGGDMMGSEASLFTAGASGSSTDGHPVGCTCALHSATTELIDHAVPEPSSLTLAIFGALAMIIGATLTRGASRGN